MNDYTKLEGDATPKQLFAIFCATKVDHRGKGLTRQEASDLLAVANASRPKVLDKTGVQIMAEALDAGKKALDACTPTPMVVTQHANMLDDNSPVVKAWHVPSGVCGFAQINIRMNTPQNKKFLGDLKKARLVGEHKSWSKAYNGGFMYWVSLGGQSMELKEAYAHAFAKVLTSYGITAYAQSRMD